MNVVFDLALDGPAWPGPLADTDHSLARPWLGPMGLLDLLETRLGLGGRFDTLLQRACRLAPELRRDPGPWRESFAADEIGACRRLLRDRDELRLSGWGGESLSQRLDALHVVTAAAGPGMPDRLQAVLEALGRRSAGIESIASHSALERLPFLWRRILAALEDGGAVVEERELPTDAASGDLAGVRQGGFEPKGDGRVALLRRYGPVETADEVAAALAARDRLDDVVVVGADDTLNGALRRHGLPCADVGPLTTASSRLLLLVLEAAFEPMEIGDLHALLVADPGPIPRGIAVRLISAIQRIPGRRTPAFKDALAEGFEGVEQDRREAVTERARTLLLPDAGREEPLPVEVLGRRLEALESWARRRSVFDPSLSGLAARARELADVVALLSVPALPRHEIRRLIANVSEAGAPSSPGQAGLGHVRVPGAVLGPADTVVWWNFSLATAPRPSRIMLTAAERKALRRAGVEIPDPNARMAIEAAAWRRPLTQASQALILACPVMDEQGEPNQPHPLWDDVSAALTDYRHAARLVTTTLAHPVGANLRRIDPAPLVAPAPTVTVGTPFTLRDLESPTSIEKLLGCSMAWALQHRGSLWSGIADPPPLPGPLLYGNVAHRALAQVLAGPPRSPEVAARQAAEWIDREAVRLCEAFSLPRYQAEKATLKNAVVRAARELSRLAVKHQVQSMRTEVDGAVTLGGQRIGGRIDLLWESPDVVLDLKWGKGNAQTLLQAGAALQLAAYQAMLQAEGRSADTAYFSKDCSCGPSPRTV